ncbi:unnamed protein product [Coccothraustes coccothraustes]
MRAAPGPRGAEAAGVIRRGEAAPGRPPPQPAPPPPPQGPPRGRVAAGGRRRDSRRRGSAACRGFLRPAALPRVSRRPGLQRLHPK